MKNRPLAWMLAGLTLGSGCYSLAAAWAATRFSRRRTPPRLTWDPRVSILKPVRPPAPAFEECLRSHAALDYPNLELLIGMAEPDESTRKAVERVQAAFPHRRIAAFAIPAPTEGNPKAAALEALVPHARGPVLLISDADIVVAPDALVRLVTQLGQPGVGVVTCLYRARPGSTLASRLDALWVSVEFPAQALVGEALAGRLEYAFGAAMLLRVADLQSIGGFRAIRPYLADDYQLGARVAAAGASVALSPRVVETVMGDSSWGEVWRRHVRWSRTIRVSQPAGHAGLFWTFTSLWSGALALVSGGRPPWGAAAAAAFLARLLAAGTTARAMGYRRFWRAAPLLPLVDLWSAAVWAWSFASRRVDWRGRRLQLDREGRIQ